MGTLGKHILRWEQTLAQAFLLASTLIIFAGGVGRFLGRPLDWSMDLATFCFAWAVFLGADLALREGRHVAVDNLVRLLPPRAQRWVCGAVWLFVALFLALLFAYSLQAAHQARFRSFQGIPGFSYAWVTLSVSLGSLLMLTTALGRFWRALREGSCS
ncbi:MAG: TRAP transporter small permease [Thermus sp.]|uniref:TRAP transporter small permease n=1 Tax=Thermus sp. TaxID=275 RepID=UPI00351B2B61